MAILSFEDWMRSQGYVYDPSIAGTNAGRGQLFSGWREPSTVSPGSRGVPAGTVLPGNPYTESAISALGLPGRYDQYKLQTQNPIVSYSGSSISTQGGGYNLPPGHFIDESGLVRFVNDEGGYGVVRDSDGNPVPASSFGTEPYDITNVYTAQDAANLYSQGYIPWDIQNVYSGLSNRQPFNLNALWGGTQYATGRVTDWAHIDPTQYEANLIASNTRNALWNQYDQLVAAGTPPPKNPDQVALDFYVKNVGPQGNTFGYGPGANTVMLAEALKSQFLNQPEVIQATGAPYQPSQEALTYAQDFATRHEQGVPTWQVFEQQGYSKDWFGSLVPAILGAMVFPGLAAGLGGGALGAAGAGALIGGTTSAIGGGDFLKGAITGGLSGGLSSGLSGVSTSIANATQLPQAVVDAAVRAGTSAASAGLTGGDVETAILNSLIGSGVQAGLGSITSTPSLDAEAQPGGFYGDQPIGPTISPDLAKALAPAITTVVTGGDPDKALAQLGAGLLSNTASTIATETGLPKAVIDVGIRAANTAMAAGAAGADVETAITNSLIQSGVSGIAGEVLPANIARMISPVISTAVMGGDVTSALVKSGLGAVKQAVTADAKQQSGLNYLDQFVDPASTQVADTTAPTQVADLTGGLSAIDQTIPSTVVSDASSGANQPLRVEVTNLPLYAGLQGAESLTGIPAGMRLANYDEVTKILDSGGSATVLPNGQAAFLMPDGNAPTQAGDIVLDVTAPTDAGLGQPFGTTAPVEPSFIDQFIDQIIQPQTETTTAPVTSVTPSITPTAPSGGLTAVDQAPTSVSPAATSPIDTVFPTTADTAPTNGLSTVTPDQAILDAIDFTAPTDAGTFVDSGTTPIDFTSPTNIGTTPTDTFSPQIVTVPADMSQYDAAIQALNAQFSQLSAAQQEQALNLINQGQTLEQAIAGVQGAFTGQIADVQQQLQSNIDTRFNSLSADQQALALNLQQQGIDLNTAIDQVQAGLTGQITGVQTDLQNKFDSLTAAQQEQALALQQQGIDLNTAIDQVQTGLTQQITDVQTGLSGQITDVQAGLQGQITGVQSDLQNKFDSLTAAQKDQALALQQQGVDLNAAIDQVQTGLSGQIAEVQSGLGSEIAGVRADLQAQYDRMSEFQRDQVLALQAQGQSFDQALNTVSTNFQTQVGDLQSTIAEYERLGYNRDLALQMAIDDLGGRMDLSAQEMQDLSNQFQTGIAGVYEQLGITTSDLQSAIDNLSYQQKLELDQRVAQGQAIDAALSDIQQGVDTRFTQVGEQISGVQQQVQSGLSGIQTQMTADKQAQAQAQQAAAYRNNLDKIMAMFARKPSGSEIQFADLKPGLLTTAEMPKGSETPVQDYSQIIGQLASVLGKRGYKVGGSVHVAGPEGKLYERHFRRGFAVGGPGTGQSDDIPTMLSDGEYVIDADTVAALGDGSSKAGAQVLDKFREEIRRHKRSAPTDRIPPKAKNPLAYLKSATRSKG